MAKELIHPDDKGPCKRGHINRRNSYGNCMDCQKLSAKSSKVCQKCKKTFIGQQANKFCKTCFPGHIAEFQRNKPPASNTGFKGVSFDSRTKKYRAQITIDRKSVKLGMFSSAEEAAFVWNKKSKELYGEKAYQNKVEGDFTPTFGRTNFEELKSENNRLKRALEVILNVPCDEPGRRWCCLIGELAGRALKGKEIKHWEDAI